MIVSYRNSPPSCPGASKTICGALEHLKELSNSLHGADLKLPETSECSQQSSRDPRGSPETRQRMCRSCEDRARNQRASRIPTIALSRDKCGGMRGVLIITNNT